MSTPTPTRPAATVVLLRDGGAGLETLLLLRSRALGFHGGEWVFPGGRVDEGDDLGEGLESEAAARRAAAREAMEEAGVTLDPAEFVTYAHWTTPIVLPKRFATYFFLARAGSGDIRVDGSEIEAHRWVRPTDALAMRERGELGLPPPTFVTLYELMAFNSASDALRHHLGAPTPRYLPHVAVAGDTFVNLLPGDAGYDTHRLDVDGPRHRVVMGKRTWRYER